jgi:putative PIN family toxin of toxin-antitoxin system
LRIVLDTNTWISGLLWAGLPQEILRLAEANALELCISPRILDELARVLSYEKLLPRLHALKLSVSDLLSYVLEHSQVFDLDPTGKPHPIVTADPSDDMFLHCALAAGAEWLISGDHHLLDLGVYGNLSIVSARAFVAQHFPDRLR